MLLSLQSIVCMQISEEVTYAVRQPTAHAINENHRVRCFRQMLLGPLDTPEQLMNLGDLMYQVTSVRVTCVCVCCVCVRLCLRVCVYLCLCLSL